MRPALAIAVLLGAAGWAPVPEPPVVTTGRAVRGEPVLVAARDVPSGWSGARDRETGVLAQLWGGYEAVPAAMRDAAIAERAAQRFVLAHAARLAPGVSSAELVTIANRVDGRVRTVAFQQTWRGLRVVGGTISVAFANDRLFVVTSQALPDVRVDVPAARGVVPTERAAAWIGRGVQVRARGERVVLPLVHGVGDVEYRVAEVLDAVAGSDAWDVYVTPEGVPLARELRTRYAAGTLRFEAGVRRPGGVRMAYGAAQADLTVDGSGRTTDADGAFTWPGNASAVVVPSVVGPLVAIANAAGALATTSLTVGPGATATWAAASSELVDAQLAAFVHASIGKAYARRILPGLATWLDQTLTVSVNESGECNASSSGDTLHFQRASSTCENTARLADVVYHELGHSVHQQAIIPGTGAFISSLSEGLSDFFAASIVGDSGIGRGFLFDDRPLRELDPAGYETSFPDDLSPSPHLTGLILAGALWDLREALVAEHGAVQGVAITEAIFAGLLQRAPNITGSYLTALTVDDDDGDLGNGTPHRCAIEAAFGKHGLAGAGFQTTRIGLPIVEGTTLTVPVTTPVGAACPVPNVTSVTVAYRVNGGAMQTLALAPGGADWRGTLDVPAHSAVDYTVTATLDDQSSVTYPRNLADPSYQLFVGPVDEIWCERFDADPEWMQLGDAGWEVAAPGSGGASGDPTVAYTGDLVLGTQVTGDGRYELGQTTAIVTPELDASAWGHVRLQYRRWLTTEDARYDRARIAIGDATLWTNAETADGTLAHLDREWRFHDLDVTAHAGAPFAIAWSLETDPTRQLGGWTIDDVCLVGYAARARCGDGVLAEDELCDDGNGERGDGCDDACAPEIADNGCCSTGSGATSPSLLALALALVRQRRRRAALQSSVQM